MSSTTTNYNLIKPAVNSPVDQDQWGSELNQSLDLIDAALTNNTAAQSQTLTHYGPDAVGGSVTFAKNRSATASSQTAVLNGDVVGQASFSGSDGTNQITAAQIIAVVNGTPASGSVPLDLVFKLGAATLAEHFRISSTGNVNLTGTDGNDALLIVEKPGTSTNSPNITLRRNGTNQFSFYHNGTDGWLLSQTTINLGGYNAATQLQIGNGNITGNAVITTTGFIRNGAAGGIGDTVFAYCTQSSVNYGDTVAGSTLFPCSISSSDLNRQGTALTGSWKCKGYLSTNNHATQFERIL